MRRLLYIKKIFAFMLFLSFFQCGQIIANTGLTVELIKNPYRDDPSSEIRIIFKNPDMSNNILIPRFLDTSYFKVFILDEDGNFFSGQFGIVIQPRLSKQKVAILPGYKFLAPPINLSSKGNFKLNPNKRYYIICIINDPNGNDLIFSNLYNFFLDDDYKIREGFSVLYKDLPSQAQQSFEKYFSEWLQRENRIYRKSFSEFISIPNESFKTVLQSQKSQK